MAKVIGPLMSLAASGSIGNKALVFRSCNRTQHVYSFPSTPTPISPAQLFQQGRFRIANLYWQALSTQEKQAWRTAWYSQANAFPVSPWLARVNGRQLFIRAAIFRMKKGLVPRRGPYDPQ